MEIYFLDENAKQHKIGKADNVDDCWAILCDYMSVHDLESAYQRVIGLENNQGVMIDFGSYDEFFMIMGKDVVKIFFSDMDGED